MSTSIKIASQVIRYYEGCSFTPYLCPAGIWTVGYGDTSWEGKFVTGGYPKSITQAEAENSLSGRLAIKEKAFECYPAWAKLYNTQKAAILSFSDNLGWYPGTEGFDTLNQYWERDSGDVPKAFGLYVNADGAPLLGLQRRRYTEYLVWYGHSAGYSIKTALLDYP